MIDGFWSENESDDEAPDDRVPPEGAAVVKSLASCLSRLFAAAIERPWEDLAPVPESDLLDPYDGAVISLCEAMPVEFSDRDGAEATLLPFSVAPCHDQSDPRCGLDDEGATETLLLVAGDPLLGAFVPLGSARDACGGAGAVCCPYALPLP